MAFHRCFASLSSIESLSVLRLPQALPCTLKNVLSFFSYINEYHAVFLSRILREDFSSATVRARR